MPQEIFLTTLDADDLKLARWITHHELDSQHAPARFRRSTALMAVLGCAAIWSALLLGVGTLAWITLRLHNGERLSLWLTMLGVAAVFLVLVVLRALWTPIAIPQGRRVSRDQAPQLFKMLDKVAERTTGPRFNEVVIDGELHAAVFQRPRLGLLGWYRDTLVLGLPLLFLLSPRQLASVVAHEYGHLNGAQNKLAAWIYRTRRGWMRLAELRESAHRGNAVLDTTMALFFNHFFPRFNARAFVVARQQEFEADAAAHAVAGTQHSSEALVVLQLGARYLNEVFWPMVFGRARLGGELRETPFREMRATLAQCLSHRQASAWLQQAYKARPSPSDTHPSLRQRLEFAKCEAELPPADTQKAAISLLGSAMEVVVAALDTQWQRQHASQWAQRVRSMSTKAARLTALNEKRESGPLSPQEAAERVACIEFTHEPEQTLLAWRQAHRTFPADADIAYGLARCLKNEPDEAAQDEVFALWTQVGQSDSRHAVPALQEAIVWLEVKERHSEAAVWRQRLKDRVALEQEATDDRMDFAHDPVFLSAGLSRAQIQDCLDVLIRERPVGAAYLVRKQTRLFSQRPFYVLVVERSRTPHQPSSRRYSQRLQAKLDFPGEFMVIDSAHATWRHRDGLAVLQQIKRVADARIYGGSALGGR
jgi:Zn-dependent protease with chaperone function